MSSRQTSIFLEREEITPLFKHGVVLLNWLCLILKRSIRHRCRRSPGAKSIFNRVDRAAISRLFFIVAASLAGLNHAVHAAVVLPLDGFYHPGKFFPVLLDGEDARNAQTFIADGCQTSSVDASTGGTRVIPMLTTGSPGDLKWAGGALPLHRLADNERLIASASIDVQIVSELFPGKHLIAARLDAGSLLPGPPAAWESVDIILLDASLYQRISDSQRSTWLAGGTTLVAVGETPPDQHWPWKKVGNFWVLSADPVGPAELVDDTVYAPTYAWTPGWSSTVRAQALGIAGLLITCNVALFLLGRNRTAALVSIGLSLAVSVGVVYWRHTLGVIDRCGGDVIITGRGWVQRDSWVYQRAKETSRQTVAWAGWTHPLFASRLGLNSSEMQLHVDGAGNLSFIYQAAVGRTLAFVRREIEPGNLTDKSASHASPMWELARQVYLQAGIRYMAGTHATGGRWDSVILQR